MLLMMDERLNLITQNSDQNSEEIENQRVRRKEGMQESDREGGMAKKHATKEDRQ